MIPPLAAIIAQVAVVAVAAIVVARWRANAAARAAMSRGAHQIWIKPPPEVAADSAAALWANMIGVLSAPRRWARPPHVGFEYVWTRRGVDIGLWVPGTTPASFIARAIEAAWPGATTTVTPARPPVTVDAACAGERLRTVRSEVLPIRTDHITDPLRAVFAAAAGLSDHECVVVQVLARPAPAWRAARGTNAAARLKSGRAVSVPAQALDRLLGVRSQARDHPDRVAQARAVLAKATQPRFDVDLRYVVTDRSAHARPPVGRARAVAGAFGRFAGEYNRLKQARLPKPAEAVAERRFRRGTIMSVEELAALAHLPLDRAVSGLSRAGAHPVPPPPQVPEPGPDRKTLGDADGDAAPRPLALPLSSACDHIHVMGATDSGKTTELTHWILDDATAGRGVVAFDCKGDQVNDLLDRLPDDAADRLVLIDPAQPGHPPGINLLAGPDPHLAVDNLVGIFKHIYADAWGPRTDDILRNACLALSTVAGATLADVPRLLTNAAYRRRITADLSDPIQAEFWVWYERLSSQGRAAAIAPVQNKLRAVLGRPFARAVVAPAPHVPGIDLGQILDGQLLLVRIPKGLLGTETVRLLGSFLLAAIWQHLTHRTNLGQPARRHCALYLDEAHNYLTLPQGLDDLLAEARAYRLSVVLAHQDLAQIPRHLRDSISANARNKIYFSCSPEDARAVENHVAPNLTRHDLVNLDAFQAVGRLVINNAPTPAFTFRTRPLPPAVAGRADHLRQAAQQRQPTPPTAQAVTPPRGDAASSPAPEPEEAPPPLPPRRERPPDQ